MKTVQYEGPPGYLGRFGQVQTGDVLQLSDAEADYTASDPNFQAPPPRSRKERKITGDTTLTVDDAGKRIVCLHTSNITATLPASPAAGTYLEFQFGDTADPTKTVTIGRNGSTIDSQASDHVLTAAEDTIGLLFNGATWAFIT